jgi:hypothetical protein
MKTLKPHMIFLIIFSFQTFAQDKALSTLLSDSLKVVHSELQYLKVEIDDFGTIKSPIARLTNDIEMETDAIVKLQRGDTVKVKALFPKIKVCYVTYNQISGYMDEMKLACQKVIEYRDSIQRELGLKKLHEIEEWEAKKVIEEIKSDSLRQIEEKKFLKEMIKKYGKKWGKIVGEKEIMIGMTKEMVLDSWGRPNDINRTVGSWGVHEQWVYSSSYLYFENGKLTSWQD